MLLKMLIPLQNSKMFWYHVNIPARFAFDYLARQSLLLLQNINGQVCSI